MFAEYDKSKYLLVFICPRVYDAVIRSGFCLFFAFRKAFRATYSHASNAHGGDIFNSQFELFPSLTNCRAKRY